MRKVSSMLVAAVLVLVALGIVMLASTSGALAAEKYEDPNYFTKRQVLFALMGTVAAVCTSRIHYHTYRRALWLLVVPTLGMLVMVLIPGIGVERLGARRWLDLGPMNFQPSELAKLTMVVMLAWWLSRIKHDTVKLTQGIIKPLVMCGVFIGLVFIEPDFGTTLLLGVVCFLMLFLAGARPEYLMVAGTGGLLAFSWAVMQDAERMRRVIAFLDPHKYADNEAFQLLYAIRAMILGGGQGQGLGQSILKHHYLPEAHTDFILAIIGEELGFAGTFGVLCLFGVILVCGLIISLRAADRFGRFLAFGLTMVLVMQALINIGVVTGCLPTKGLALPFISNGGSHLLMGSAMIGILINIAHRSQDDPGYVKEGGKWT